MQRITVSVDDEYVEVARRAVAEGRAASVSAWVSDAMREKALARIQLELELDELRETEPYTRDDIEFAARALGVDVDEVAALLATPIRPQGRTRAPR